LSQTTSSGTLNHIIIDSKLRELLPESVCFRTCTFGCLHAYITVRLRRTDTGWCRRSALPPEYTFVTCDKRSSRRGRLKFGFEWAEKVRSDLRNLVRPCHLYIQGFHCNERIEIYTVPRWRREIRLVCTLLKGENRCTCLVKWEFRSLECESVSSCDRFLFWENGIAFGYRKLSIC
jgi:hypothetical protein